MLEVENNVRTGAKVAANASSILYISVRHGMSGHRTVCMCSFWYGLLFTRIVISSASSEKRHKNVAFVCIEFYTPNDQTRNRNVLLCALLLPAHCSERSFFPFKMRRMVCRGTKRKKNKKLFCVADAATAAVAAWRNILFSRRRQRRSRRGCAASFVRIRRGEHSTQYRCVKLIYDIMAFCRRLDGRSIDGFYMPKSIESCVL